MDHQPELHFNEQRRKELKRRIEEIQHRPHPGQLARRMRERQGLSVDDLAELVGVEPEAVMNAERSGVITEVATKACADSMLEDHDDPTEDLVNRYVEVLRPTGEEEMVPRRDVVQDLDDLKDALSDIIPARWWEQAKDTQAKDPWEP